MSDVKPSKTPAPPEVVRRTPEEWGQTLQVLALVVTLARARAAWGEDALVDEEAFRAATDAARLELSVSPSSPPLRAPVDDLGHVLPGPSRCAPGRSPGVPRRAQQQTPVLGGRRR